MMLAPNHRNKVEWAELIRTAWQSSVSGILECGRLLVRAKAELPHGEWVSMVEADLPFSRQTAFRLQKIATDTRLVTHVQHLPPNWGTLYELTTLDDDEFTQAVEAGAIHPEMQRGEVSRLRQREAYEARTDEGCTVDDLGLLISAGKTFPVIYADPPWEFRVYSGKGKQRSADRHYDTQGLDWIKSLPVQQLAERDSALLLWAVMPELPGALEVISAWGFEYKTAAFTWIKQNRSGRGLFTGMGYWTRANAELCLLATRGAPKRQAMDVHQVVMSPVSAHSRKPDEVQVRIERLLPGPYLELFGRRATPGWTVWGNDISRSLFHQSIPEFAGSEIPPAEAAE